MPPVECCPPPFRAQIKVVGRQVEYVVRVVVRMRECILRFYFYKSRKLIARWKTPVMLRRYLGSNEEGPPVLFSSRLEYLACEYPVSWRSEHAGANR